MEDNRFARVIVPLVIVVAAGLFRFINLGHPDRIIFDETYYAKDARAYLEQGVEEGFAVHPPIGKWAIAAGLPFFPRDTDAEEIEDAYQPIGWRVSTAVLGTLTVLLTYLIGARLLRWRGAAAFGALLAATDGLLIVQSRTSMLDGPLAFFVVLSAWLLLVDFDRSRLDEGSVQLDDTLPPTPPEPVDDTEATADERAPVLVAGGSDDVAPRTFADADYAWLDADADTPPPKRVPVQLPVRSHGFRLLAGVAFGLAVATKWSGVLALFAGLAMVVGWELAWRKRTTGHLFTDFYPVIRSVAVCFVLVPMGVYVASYVPWFMNYAHTTEGKDVCKDEEGAPKEPCHVTIPGRLLGWARYQEKIWNFHKDLEADHPYRAPAWTWPLLGRPVVYYYESCDENRANRVPQTDSDGKVTTPEPCEVEQGDSGEIIALGNPALWWTAVIALIPLGAGMLARDRRAWFLFAFWGVQFLPWLIPQFNQARPVFYFYMTPAVPFLALIVAYSSVWLNERRDARVRAGLPLLRPHTAWTIAAITCAMLVVLGGVIAWLRPSLLNLYALLAFVAFGSTFGNAWLRSRQDREEAAGRVPRWAGLSPGTVMAVSIAVLAVGLFLYFYPVFTGVPLPYDSWRQRMWFRSWI